MKTYQLVKHLGYVLAVCLVTFTSISARAVLDMDGWIVKGCSIFTTMALLRFSELDDIRGLGASTTMSASRKQTGHFGQ